MYKVLIVDDEAPARRMLNYLINWEDSEFEIVDTAVNGKDAIEKYNKYQPELIITDIQMPVMDGLEMIEKIREEDETQKFVILSCHENFNYAKRALKLGVKDYLIKDLVTEENLYELLLRLSKELEDEQNKISEDDREKYNKLKPVAETLTEIFALDTLLQIEETEFSKEMFGIKEKFMAVLSIHIDSYAESNLNFEDVAYFAYEINEILKIEGGGQVFSINGNGQLSVLAGFKGGASKRDVIESCNAILQKIRNAFMQIDWEMGITIGISNFYSEINTLREHIEQAENAMKLKLFIGKNRNIYHSLFPDNFMEVSPELFKERMKKLSSHLAVNDEEKLIQELKRLYNEEVKGFMQYNYLNYVNSKLLNYVIYEMDKSEIPYKEVFGENYIPTRTLNNLETVDEICEWFIRVFKTVLAIRKTDTKVIYSKHVSDTLELIEKKYSDNEIGLNMIASELGLHKVYLCRIFKEETGKNIKDIIQHERIERAKELILNSNYRLYEIASMIGYSTPQQLNIYFKKITGKSPNVYKTENS